MSSSKNTLTKKLVVALLAPLPSVIFLRHCSAADPDSLSPLWSWCYHHHPLLLANALFFFNVNLLVWLVGQIQSSHWTVIPMLLAHYFASHPTSQANAFRSTAVVFLTYVWAVRLTHSYFRREWGAREDWRLSDIRIQRWWWASFFVFYLPQQVLLMGICFPLYMVHSIDSKLNVFDFIAALICFTGVTIAYIADAQLHEFVTLNEQLKAIGFPVVPNLDRGLWFYSRHPNYFGEQLWWWGLAIFGWNLGFRWCFVGALINSLCLGYVELKVKCNNSSTSNKKL